MDTPEQIEQFLMQIAEAMWSPGNLQAAVKVLEKAREKDSFVWLAGNGGSASTASHFANDLRKMCGIRAIALPDLIPVVTAYGNDNGWHKMFSDALSGYKRPGDVLVVFSCSGYSGNVIEAVKGWQTDDPMIIFTGNDRLSKLSNAAARAGNAVGVFVDNPDIMVQESVHLMICHAIVSVLKKE